MDESLGLILRLMKETVPITYESEWFTLKDALLHLRPYTRPHMPVAVAAAQSPAGMVLAGKHGAGVLSISVQRVGMERPPLKQFWKMAEESAAEHGQTMNREDWRLVLHVHLAESRQEAIKQARFGAGRYQREYFENTLGNASGFNGPPNKIIDFMRETGQWCVGTPDDLVDFIMQLDEESGGFGGLLVQATEWAPREQVFHSYELLARYVMPRFQGSLANLKASEKWSGQMKDEFQALRRRSIDKARQDYAQARRGSA
jgi:limonene 1,2-monooxygenase